MTNAMNGGAGRKGIGFVWPVSSGGSFDINAGDLIWFDTSAHIAKSLDSDAHAAFLLGVAYDSSFLNLYGQKKYEAGIVAICEGVVRLFGTSGETYNDGTLLYFGADAQTVTNVNPGSGHAIGTVYLPMGNTLSSVAAGTLIEVLIAPQYPNVGVA